MRSRTTCCLILYSVSFLITPRLTLSQSPNFQSAIEDDGPLVESVIARTTEVSFRVNNELKEKSSFVDTGYDLDVAESIFDVFRGRDREEVNEPSAQTIQPTFVMVPTANGQFISPQMMGQPQIIQSNQNQNQNQNRDQQTPAAPQIILVPTPMMGGMMPQSAAQGMGPGGRRRLVRVVRGGGGGRGGPRGFGRAQALRGAGGVMGPGGRRLMGRGAGQIRQVMAFEDFGSGGRMMQSPVVPQVLQPIVIQAAASQQQQETEKSSSSSSKGRQRDRDRDSDNDRQPIIQVITPPAAPPFVQQQRQPEPPFIMQPLITPMYQQPPSPPQQVIQSVVASSAPNPYAAYAHQPTIQELLKLQPPHSTSSQFLASASGHSQVATHQTPNHNGGVSNTIVIQPPMKPRDKRRQKRRERVKQRLQELLVTEH